MKIVVDTGITESHKCKNNDNRSTCAGLAAGVALSAAMPALKKALWTLIHTLSGALQV